LKEVIDPRRADLPESGGLTGATVAADGRGGADGIIGGGGGIIPS